MYQEFDHLLEEQSPIESYIEWLDTMVDRCVVKVGGREWEVQPWALQPCSEPPGGSSAATGPRSPSPASARPAPVMHVGP